MVPAELIPHAFRIRLEGSQWQALGLFPEARIGSWLKQLLGRHEGETAALWWPVWSRTPHTRLPAGAQLELALYALPAARHTLQTLLRCLRGLPATAAHLPDAPFGNGLRCVAITPLDPAGPDDGNLATSIATQAQQLLELPYWRLCWRSPARLRRSGGKAGSGDARFIHHERDLDGARLRQLLGDTLLVLRKDSGASAPAPDLPVLPVVASELFWLDLEYRDPQGHGKSAGGLLGELLLRRPDDLNTAQAHALALASAVGCGQRRAFGMGQFALETLDGTALKCEPSAPPSLLRQLGRIELLAQTRWQRPSPLENPADDPDSSAEPHPPQESDPLAGWLQRAADRWARGEHVPAGALQPCQLPKPGGGVRQLLVPRLGDRILQRALLDQLAPAVDTLFSNRSFGFRPGRSRMQARDDLLALIDRGLRTVATLDLRTALEQLDYWRIAVRLRALLGHDPAVHQILEFIAAPSQDNTDNAPGERSHGLPQGAPLTAWLSNLMLDDLDRELAQAGHAAIRHGNHLAIAARDHAQAQAGLQHATGWLDRNQLPHTGGSAQITTHHAITTCFDDPAPALTPIA